jgi:hypothetical protein
MSSYATAGGCLLRMGPTPVPGRSIEVRCGSNHRNPIPAVPLQEP